MKTASEMTASRATTGSGVLVDPQWLEARLLDPRTRVVEVDVSPAAYNEWHIDGAVAATLLRRWRNLGVPTDRPRFAAGFRLRPAAAGTARGKQD